MSSRAGPNFVCLLAMLVLLMINCEPVDSDGECGVSDMVYRRGCHILCTRNIDMGDADCYHHVDCLCRVPLCYDLEPDNENGTGLGSGECLRKSPIRCETDDYGNRFCKPYDYYDLIPQEYKRYHHQQSSISEDYPDDYEYS